MLCRRIIACFALVSMLMQSLLFPFQSFASTPHILISEVEYNPSGPENEAEWLELYNPTASAVDISGWSVKEGVSPYFTFPPGTILASGAYLLVVNDTTSFQSEHGGITPDIDMDGSNCNSDTECLRLNNSSAEKITLYDNTPDMGTVIDEVTFNAGGFATAANGKSICRNSSSDTDTGSDWDSDCTPTPGQGTLTVTGVDNVAPTGTITYDETNWTNGTVTMTLTTNEAITTPTGWIKVSDTSFTKEVSANTSGTLSIKDLADNTANVSFSVQNIDKNLPVCGSDWGHTPTAITNGDVTVTLSGSSDDDSGLASTNSYTCTVSVNNTSCNFEIADNAGNKATCTSPIVSNIDNVAPTGTITYDETNWTNGTVTMTLTTNEAITTPTGWVKVSDTSFTKEVSANTSGTLSIKDLADNTANVSFSVQNIDTTAPICGSWSYYKTILTNEDVTATLALATDEANGSGIKIAGGTCTLTSNTDTCEVIIEDYAKNQTTCTSGKVTNIDKEKPVITLSGNLIQEVVKNATYTDAGATATDNEDNDAVLTSQIIVSGDTVDTSAAVGEQFTITYNVTDTAGNAATQVTRTVTIVSGSNPIITLNGNATETVEVKNTYTDAGASASDTEDGDITSSIVTNNPVDINTIGSYTITYNVSDSSGNQATEVTRIIEVVDTTKPLLNLLGSSVATIVKNTSYTDAGATCTDNYDPTCTVVSTGTVDTTTIGTYELTYTATDTSGNTTIKTKTVTVTSGENPIIMLKGDSTITVEKHSTYVDKGASANDTEDGDISTSILIQGLNDIDTSKEGTYVVTYNVTDSSGNKAQEVIRTVKVVRTTGNAPEDDIFEVENDENVRVGEPTVPTVVEDKNKDTPTKQEKRTEKKSNREYKTFGGKSYSFLKGDNCPIFKNIQNPDFNLEKRITFTDVSNIQHKDSIYRLARVDNVFNEPIVHGTTSETFEPDRGITRAEFLAIVLQSHCIDVYKPVTTTPFTDLEIGDWKTNVVAAGLEKGIVYGDKKDGSRIFRPNDTISKVEAFAILIAMRNLRIEENYIHGYSDSKAPWQDTVMSVAEYFGLEEKGTYFYPNASIDRKNMAHDLVTVIEKY